MAAESDLAALPDEELAGVGEHQMVRVEPVPALDALVVPLGREVALGRNHPALTGTGGGAGHGRAPGERHLRLERERAEAHPGDVDRDVELNRILREARTDHGLRLALFSVTHNHETGELAAKEQWFYPLLRRYKD